MWVRGWCRVSIPSGSGGVGCRYYVGQGVECVDTKWVKGWLISPFESLNMYGFTECVECVFQLRQPIQQPRQTKPRDLAERERERTVVELVNQKLNQAERLGRERTVVELVNQKSVVTQPHFQC